MSIKGNALIKEILELCQFKSDDQVPQNEDGNCQKNKQSPKEIHYCDLTGVPLN